MNRATTFQIFTEWLHRLLAVVIGILVIWSHYAVWQRRAALPGAIEAHLHATVLLVIQAAAGAITVGFDNAPWSVALHLLLALAFPTALLRVALMARLAKGPLPERFRVSREAAVQQAPPIAWLALASLALLLVGAWLATGYHRGAWKCTKQRLPSVIEREGALRGAQRICTKWHLPPLTVLTTVLCKYDTVAL